MAAPEGIELADLITRTAHEIRKARDEAPKNDPVISLSGCELTLAVTVSAEASGGLKVWLLDISAKGKGERVSTIKLTFGPIGQDGTNVVAFMANQTPSDEAEPPITGGKRARKAK
ncbi:trypco2 family protein [Acidiphilium iwatense]|nr:trypco2 family protein [Acidiphilium iwatense]